jgi:hypothetical protein
MSRLTLALAFSLAISTACATNMPVTQTNQAPEALARMQTSPSPEVTARIQTIPGSEISGAVNIGGDRVMLIADEGYDVKIVSNAAATFKSGDPKDFASNMKPAIADVTVGTDASKASMDDIEDAAWDNKEQAAFVITSHSRSKKQDDVPDPKGDKPGRHKLARLVFKVENIEPAHPETDVLEEALKMTSFVREAMKKPHQEGGNTGTFNIEGLAYDPITSSLLIGLRSPTQMSNGKACAVVFRLKNPHEVFKKDKPAAPEFDAQVISLDLGGLGIRGMTYDDERKGYWIVAGRSDDPDVEPTTGLIFSSLWFWDAAKPKEPPLRVQTDSFGLVNIEGVCLLKIDGQQGLLLISDDGKNKPSRYLWIPVPKLVTP